MLSGYNVIKLEIDNRKAKIKVLNTCKRKV